MKGVRMALKGRLYEEFTYLNVDNFFSTLL